MKNTSLTSLVLWCVAMSTSRVEGAAHGTTSTHSQANQRNVVAVVGDVRVDEEALDARVGTKLLSLRTQEYRIRRRVLDDYILDLLLEQAAVQRRISVDALIKHEIEEKITPPTVEEAKVIYERSRTHFADRSEADAMNTVLGGLRDQRRRERRQEYLSELRTRFKVEILLTGPRVQCITSPDDPAMGPEAAPVTIVEYVDYQCGYCARSSGMVKEIVKNYGKKVRLVVRDFPLPMHKGAPMAAEAAACARDMGRFWEMHDKLFANMNARSRSDLRQNAIDIGLDADAFDLCMNSGRHAMSWRVDKEDGEKCGVTGTPAFLVNGLLVQGAIPIREFSRIIDDELTRLSTSETTLAAAAP